MGPVPSATEIVSRCALKRGRAAALPALAVPSWWATDCKTVMRTFFQGPGGWLPLRAEDYTGQAGSPYSRAVGHILAGPVRYDAGRLGMDLDPPGD